jgi:ubiquinone/menaquinone biosynthesis C-methylase UbiE
MRKPKSDRGEISRQREGMRRWARRNARLYDLWAGILAMAGYRRMVDRVTSRLPETGIAVDVGCGTGELLGTLRSRRARLRAIGCDLGPEFIAIARRRHPGASMVCGDAERLPLRGAAADAAVSLGVLGHLLSVEPAIHELARTVRPGGTVAIWTRTDGGVSRCVSRLFGWMNRGVVFRLHSPTSVRSALEQNGIQVDQEEAVAGGRLWIGTRRRD